MKKIISILLVFSVLTSLSFCLNASAGGEVQSAADSAENAYKFMTALGVLDESDIEYSPESIITRGLFSKLALHVGNYDEVLPAASGEVFSDVANSNKYAPYIETAYSLGIVSGYGDGTFGVNDSVTVAQAEKMLVCTLGYERLATYGGGFPVGYDRISANLKLLSGVTLSKNEELNMANAMIMMRNALNGHMLIPTGYSNGEADFVIDSEKTVLTERFKLESMSGILDANGYTDLIASESVLDSGYMSVDKTVFKYNGDSTGLIGCSVEVWYDYSASVPVALYIEPTEDNRIWEFEAGDVYFNQNEAECHYDDGNTKNLRLSEYASYIVNGKMAVKSLDELESIEKGSFRFISNNGDSTIDVVQVTKYDTYRVKSVNADTKSLMTYCGKIFSFDEANTDVDVFIEKDGTPIDFSQISALDIILVAQSEGAGYNRISFLASSKKITEKLAEIGEETVTTESGVNNVDNSVKASLIAGNTYEFSFDAFDNIAYAHKTNNSYVYGFLYAVKSEAFKTRCNIFSEYGNWVELDFAEKVKINGNTYKNDEISAWVENAGDEIRQIIRYNVDDENRVVMIDFCADVPIGSETEAEALHEDTFRLSFDGSARYLRTPQSFDGLFYIDASVKTFEIPNDYNKDDFKVTEGITYSNDTSYTFKAYDVDEKRNAALLEITATGEKYSSMDYPSGYPFMIVMSKGECLDYDGSARPSIVGYYNGHKITFPVNIDGEFLKQSDYDALQKGDVIQINYDDHGILRFFRKYDTSNTDFESYTGRSAIWNSAVMKSKVVEVIPGTVKFGIENNGTTTYIMGYHTSPVYLYDTKTQTVTKTATAGIMEGDTIVLSCYNYSLNEAVIIR